MVRQILLFPSLSLIFLLLAGCSSSTTPNLSSGASQQKEFTCTNCSGKLLHAIELLKQRGWWNYVSKYISGVIESPGSGSVNPRTRIMSADSRTSMEQPVSYIASTLVHEALHVERGHIGCTADQEAEAIRKQAEACLVLGCSANRSYILSQIGVHCA